MALCEVLACDPSRLHCTMRQALVGLNFARINFAAARLEGGTRATWWSLDLGPGRALACNYYTLRADASYNFPRCWTLQVRCVSLRGSLCRPGGRAGACGI